MCVSRAERCGCARSLAGERRERERERKAISNINSGRTVLNCGLLSLLPAGFFSLRARELCEEERGRESGWEGSLFGVFGGFCFSGEVILDDARV